MLRFMATNSLSLKSGQLVSQGYFTGVVEPAAIFVPKKILEQHEPGGKYKATLQVSVIEKTNKH